MGATKWVLLGAGSVFWLAAAASAKAAEAEPGSAGLAVDNADIIVTANKRAERLVDVGGTVNAISGAELGYRNSVQIQDFAAQIPGFNFQPSGNRATRLILRGLNTGGAGATVAVVADETPLSYQSGLANGSIDTANLNTYDLERIEVLKGPQGTLYGATAQGGLLKYVTRAPNLEQIEGIAETGTEFVRQGGTGWFGRGAINVPIIDGVAAIRATGFYEDLAGFIDNPLIGRNDFNSGERWGGRISLLVKPVDWLSVRITGFRQTQRFDDNGTVEVVGANADPTAPPPNEFDIANGGRLVRNSLYGSASRNVYEYVNGLVELDAGFATFVSSTSFGGLSSRFNNEFTFVNAAPGLTFSDAVAGLYGEPVGITQPQVNESDRFNQEVRIESKPEFAIGGLGIDWQAGLFLARESIVFDQTFDVLSRATGQILTAPIAGGALQAPARYRETSGFANVTLKFSEAFDLALGGRYTENEQQSQLFYTAGFATGGAAITPLIRSEESKWTYSAALRYRFDASSLLYGRIASGYRPGGPNFGIPNAPNDFPLSYGSDTTTNYELGLRTALFDRAVTIDIAAFHIDWKDIQINTAFTSTTGQQFSVVGNAGTASSTGVELDLGWRILPGVRISTVGAYTRAKLTEDAPNLGARSGEQLAFVPRFSNTLNLDAETGLGSNLKGFAGLSWTHTGKRFTDFSASPANPGHIELPSYNTVNAQAGLEFEDFTLSVYARNIGDVRGLTGYSRNGGANLTGNAQIVQPRTIGVRLAVNY